MRKKGKLPTVEALLERAIHAHNTTLRARRATSGVLVEATPYIDRQKLPAASMELVAYIANKTEKLQK